MKYTTLILTLLTLNTTINAQVITCADVRAHAQSLSSNDPFRYVHVDIKNKAESDWPNDFTMQEFVMEQQCEAFGKFIKAIVEYKDDEPRIDIMVRTMVNWGVDSNGPNGKPDFSEADWNMIVFVFEQQLEAYNRLNN